MFIKTVSTASGINPIKFDETGGVFYWILNTGSSTVYASTKSAFTSGDDGVVSLGPKESRRLETNNDTIYILGEGQVEIHNQRDGICSFKQAPTSSGSGGGGTVDAYTKTESDAKYAAKSDVPDAYTKTESDDKYAQKTDVVPYKMGMDFGTCRTPAETVVKSVTTLHKVAPALGAVFAVKFVNAVPAQARLNINGLTGYIQYRGGSIPNGVINARDIATFMYYSDSGSNRFEIISVENGGKANSAETLTDWGTRTVTDANDAPFGFCAASDCENAPNTFWSTILTTGSSSATNYKTQIAFPWAFGADENRIRYRCENNGEWGSWQEISTTPIKSTTFSGTTDVNSNMSFWAKTENKIPILFECENKNATIFYGNSGYFYAYVTDHIHQNVNNTAVSGIVYYVEV